jgi:hypothetical protein
VSVTREQVLAQLYPDEPNYDGAARLGSEAIPHLMHLVREGDPDLASKATSLASTIDAAGSIEVLDLAARSPDPVLRVAAASSLGNLSDMPVALTERMLDDEDVGVRKLTLKSVGVRKPTGIKSKVQDIAQNDTNVALRALARRVADQLP